MPESLFDEYCQVSSCAGVIDYYSSKHKCGKLFWICIMLAALGLTAFQTYGMVRDYVNGGAGQFQSKVTRESLNGNRFPSVTICNFNRAMKSKLVADEVDPKVIEYAYGAIPENYDLWMRTFKDRKEWQSQKLIYEEHWTNYSKKLGKEPNVAEMLKKYGQDCESTVLRLAFNMQEDPAQVTCKNTTLMREVLTNYGRCWAFTAPEEQSRPGPAGGLRLLLNPATYEYPKDMVMNNFLQQGLVLAIGYYPEPYFTDPIVVAPGTYAYVSISGLLQTYTKEDYPIFKRPCREDTELHHVNVPYTGSNCKLDCLANASATLYSCVPLLESKSKIRMCTPNETIEKIIAFYDSGDNYWNDQSKIIPNARQVRDEFRSCEKACINPCEERVTVSSSVSYMTMAGETSKHALQDSVAKALPIIADHNISVTELIRVDIYSPTLQFLKIDISEETPIFSFIGNVGGNLGLYTGVCIMSIIQALYYLIDGLFHCCCKHHKDPIRATTTVRPLTSTKVIYH